MAATLPDGPQAAAQRPDGRERGARWTRPRRSAARLPQECSRCAGGGKPRALPRGIGGLPLLNDALVDKAVAGEVHRGFRHERRADAAVPAEKLIAALVVPVRRTLMDVNLSFRVAVADFVDVFFATENNASFGIGRCIDGSGHSDLLGIGLHRATHDQIIAHDAPIVENFLQIIFEGDSKPSNATSHRGAACGASGGLPG